MTHLIDQDESKVEDSTKNSLAATVLKYISQKYHFQYDGSVIFERCAKILNPGGRGRVAFWPRPSDY